MCFTETLVIACTVSEILAQIDNYLCITKILISKHCIYVVTTLCNDTTSQQRCVNVVYYTTLPQLRCNVSWESNNLREIY